MADLLERGEIHPDVWPERLSFAQEVVAALEREGDPRFADVDDASLEEAVRVGAAEIAAATCRWLLAVAELVVRGIWAQQAARTPAEWLSWAVSMAPSTAREHVRVALRLCEFPSTTERFGRGEISYSKVRAITRVRMPELEETLLRYAEFATGAQLEAIVSGIQQVARRASREPDEQFERRSCHWTWDEDGMLDLRVKLPPDLGAATVQRIDALVERAVREERRIRTSEAASAGSDVCQLPDPMRSTVIPQDQARSEPPRDQLRGPWRWPSDVPTCSWTRCGPLLTRTATTRTAVVVKSTRWSSTSTHRR